MRSNLPLFARSFWGAGLHDKGATSSNDAQHDAGRALSLTYAADGDVTLSSGLQSGRARRSTEAHRSGSLSKDLAAQLDMELDPFSSRRSLGTRSHGGPTLRAPRFMVRHGELLGICGEVSARLQCFGILLAPL